MNFAGDHIPRFTSGHSFPAAGIALVTVTIGVAGLATWGLRRDALTRAMRATNSLGVLLAKQNAGADTPRYRLRHSKESFSSGW
jgi:hypothetical protein